jgi:copper chaperone CopZ
MRMPAERVLISVVLIIAAGMISGCNRSTTVDASFTVEGMHCESCSSAITESLEKVEGVESASADHVSGSAQARFSSPGVSPDELAAEIEGLGYTVTAVETTPVEG